MTVLFTIAGLHPESGGPARSVPALCEALGRQGVHTEIVTLDYRERFSNPLIPEAKLVGTTLVDCSSALASRTQWTRRFKAALRERCRVAGVQLVHDTGLWLLTNHAAAKVCEKSNLPRIVSPRGMLSSWALQFRGLKKRTAWRLYQRVDLESARVLHATSEAEAKDFRAVGLRQPIAVIPNGVELPPLTTNHRPLTTDHRTLLFLGRIHPKKGLLDLVRAWAALAAERHAPGAIRTASSTRAVVGGRHSDWRVVLAGAGEDGHVAELKAEIKMLKLENSFQFVGPVEGAAKWDLYRNADLFVLPSYSENFGLVVAEALASGVPVITTKGTPWQELETHRCGWWVDVGAQPLQSALREAIALSDAERLEMGKRGRKLAEAKYTWPNVAEQMKSVYEWMLGSGPKPECVKRQEG